MSWALQEETLFAKQLTEAGSGSRLNDEASSSVHRGQNEVRRRATWGAATIPQALKTYSDLHTHTEEARDMSEQYSSEKAPAIEIAKARATAVTEDSDIDEDDNDHWFCDMCDFKGTFNEVVQHEAICTLTSSVPDTTKRAKWTRSYLSVIPEVSDESLALSPEILGEPNESRGSCRTRSLRTRNTIASFRTRASDSNGAFCLDGVQLSHMQTHKSLTGKSQSRKRTLEVSSHGPSKEARTFRKTVTSRNVSTVFSSGVIGSPITPDGKISHPVSNTSSSTVFCEGAYADDAKRSGSSSSIALRPAPNTSRPTISEVPSPRTSAQAALRGSGRLW